MERSDVHFEIFVQRHGRGSGWSLVDAVPSRAKAMAKAETLAKGERFKAVRVVKETLQEGAGTYLTLTVAEFGDAGSASKSIDDDESDFPCFRPQDLYSTHARATISRLLGDYLGRNYLTVSELLHRADAVEQLSATGTVLQHAIQKAAVAHAGSTGQSVQHAVRQLNDLSTKLAGRLYKDDREGRFPVLGKQGLAGVIELVECDPEADYLLCGAVAGFLKGTACWGKKLVKVLGLIRDLPDDGPERDVCLRILDIFVSEIVAGRAAIHDIMGDHPNPGALLKRMVEVFLGSTGADRDALPEGIRLLAEEFALGNLRDARAAVGQRILAELRSPRRLYPDCLETELAMTRALASKIVLAQGKDLPLEDIMEAFTVRSRHLVSASVLEPYLESLTNPAERVSRLIALEANIIGEENKRTLAGLLKPQIIGPACEQHFLSFSGNPLVPMREIARLQSEIFASGFPDLAKRQLADALDTLAGCVEARAGLLEGLVRKPIPTDERVLALLRLITAGVLTKGKLTHRAKHLVMGQIQDPAFARALAAAAKDTEGLNRVRDIKAQLDLADLEGLASVA